MIWAKIHPSRRRFVAQLNSGVRHIHGTESDGFATFGEIESVSCCKNRYILEGDFGAITVFADTTLSNQPLSEWTTGPAKACRLYLN